MRIVLPASLLRYQARLLLSLAPQVHSLRESHLLGAAQLSFAEFRELAKAFRAWVICPGCMTKEVAAALLM